MSSTIAFRDSPPSSFKDASRFLRYPAAWREFTAEGGLMNYGADIREQFREVGSLAARILRGEKPADMPVRRPTKLGFALNLKTARSLGIEPSPMLLSLADEVIE
jgi:putative tryptophan/tyrosine transport system substrate-binding protein